MACFADIDVSQGSVATYARCCGSFNIHLTTNLPRNLPVKHFLNRLIFDRIMVMSLWPHFLAHFVYYMGFILVPPGEYDDLVGAATVQPITVAACFLLLLQICCSSLWSPKCALLNGHLKFSVTSVDTDLN